MKTLITVLAIVTLSASAMAHNPGQGTKKKRGAVAVKGIKAQKIYEALDTEILTKDRAKATVDIKKVASLRCAKRIKKEDTSKITYRCVLRGKKMKPKKRGNRAENRANRVQK